MQRLLKYILKISAAVIIILFLLDTAYTYIYKTGTPRNKLAYLLSIKNKDIDYVFIGSSRVDNNINPEVIDSITGKTSINLGIQGGKIDDYFLILQLLEKQHIKTEKIFIQIDYAFNMEGNSNILNSYLMPYLHEPILSEFIKDRSPDYFFLKNIPFYRYMKYDYKLGFREFFNVGIGNEHHTDLSIGYQPLYDKSGEVMAGKLPSSVNKKNKNLNALMEFAERNEVKVVYFMAPYCSSTSNLDFGSKLQEKIPNFTDFSTIFNDHNEYFFNCSHLNDLGAQKFSGTLGRMIIENKI